MVECIERIDNKIMCSVDKVIGIAVAKSSVKKAIGE